MSAVLSSTTVRREFRGRRRLLGASRQTEHAHAVSRSVVCSGVLLKCRTVGAYLAHQQDGELDPGPLISRLWSMGKRVATPVVHPSRPHMDFYLFSPATRLTANRFGIFEPDASSGYVNPLAVEMMLVPLVAFDTTGNRLGMGAGFYDRYLGRIPDSMRPLVVGLAHQTQHTTRLHSHALDVGLDAVVTESGWQPFTQRAMVVGRRL